MTYEYSLTNKGSSLVNMYLNGFGTSTPESAIAYHLSMKLRYSAYPIEDWILDMAFARGYIDRQPVGEETVKEVEKYLRLVK